jgi:hypothetical protein
VGYTNLPQYAAQSMALGSASTLYILHVVTNEGTITLSLDVSTNSAESWINSSSVVYEGTQTVTHPKVAAWSNRVLVAWRFGDADQLVCCQSDDGGESWGTTATLFQVNSRSSYMVYENEPGYDVAAYDGNFTVAIGITNKVGSLSQFKLNAFALTNDVILRWPQPTVYGAGSDTVLIRRSSDTYPLTLSDGAELYTGDALIYTHNWMPNVTCYYSIWLSDDGTSFYNPTAATTSDILLFETDL